MKVENLDTAARFAEKRKKLVAIQELLSSYVTQAEVHVVVNMGSTKKTASIHEETFNALMYKLVESEIANIDHFVEQL